MCVCVRVLVCAGGWLDVCVVCCVFGVRGVSVLRVGLGLRCRRMVGVCVVCLLCVRVCLPRPHGRCVKTE